MLIVPNISVLIFRIISIFTFLLTWRSTAERCVNRLKQRREIPTRYDKRAATYRAMVVIASLMIWLTNDLAKLMNRQTRPGLRALGLFGSYLPRDIRSRQVSFSVGLSSRSV